MARGVDGKRGFDAKYFVRGYVLEDKYLAFELLHRFHSIIQ